MIIAQEIALVVGHIQPPKTTNAGSEVGATIALESRDEGNRGKNPRRPKRGYDMGLSYRVEPQCGTGTGVPLHALLTAEIAVVSCRA